MRKSLKASGKKKREFVSTQELAPLMGLSRQTIRNWINKGDIKAHHMGRKLDIPLDEALRILNRYGLHVPDWLKHRHVRH